jgi:hypothetical protein
MILTTSSVDHVHVVNRDVNQFEHLLQSKMSWKCYEHDVGNGTDR